jgi:hypothetical protein
MAVRISGRFGVFEGFKVPVEPPAPPPQNNTYAFATEEGETIVDDDGSVFTSEEN